MTGPHDQRPADPTNDHAGGDDGIWNTIEQVRNWLDDANGTDRQELSMRILKIAEEYGEAATAWAGTTGQNPRKGTTHSHQDVAAELGDVAFTALVAAASLDQDPRDVLAQVAAKVRTRLTGSRLPDPLRAAADGSTRDQGEHGD